MAKRDPHLVLGVEPGAAPTAIKAAWRRLARQHHPDLIGDDPEASRVATRKMAEINEAYAAISRGGTTSARSGAPSGGATFEQDTRTATQGRPAEPQADPTRHRSARHVGNGKAAERTLPTPMPPMATGARATTLSGQPPLRFATHHREPPRASDPTGPLERGRIRDFRRPPPPALEDATVRELEFGKFRGHTLGEVAAFEPSYIDWLANTITRDPELVAAARVLQADLDERGVPRRVHASVRDAPGAPSGRSA